MQKHNVLIIGGGFGGVKASQILGKDSRFSVRMVDPKNFMEYHAATYRLTTGRSPMEVCIPYSELLKGCDVEIVTDAVAGIDNVAKKAKGFSGSVYSYDSVILSVGCESSYFGIEGVEQNAFSINCVNDALRLRCHIHSIFERAKSAAPDEKVPLLHIAVIGGGASGTELSGEFAAYTRELSSKHGVDPSLVTIDLIEAMPRLLPGLPEDLSAHALKRLRELGVNVYLNRSVVREDTNGLFLKDMEMTTKTVVWTAGLKANSITSTIQGLSLDRRGRVVVDDGLRAKGIKDFYAIGDVASTEYSGMAQTALADASYVAGSIKKAIEGKSVEPYVQPKPSYAVPVGPSYAVVWYRGLKFHGFAGWILRRAADFIAFNELLGPVQALRAWIAGTMTQESCTVCEKSLCTK